MQKFDKVDNFKMRLVFILCVVHWVCTRNLQDRRHGSTLLCSHLAETSAISAKCSTLMLCPFFSFKIRSMDYIVLSPLCAEQADALPCMDWSERPRQCARNSTSCGMFSLPWPHVIAYCSAIFLFYLIGGSRRPPTRTSSREVPVFYPHKWLVWTLSTSEFLHVKAYEQ